MSRTLSALASTLLIIIFCSTAHATEADRLYTSGAKYFSAGDYDSAEKMFIKALDKDHMHQSSMFMMGETLSLDIRRLGEAEQWYKDALKRAEFTGRDVQKALNSLGSLYILLGHYEDALECFERLIDEYPDFFDIAKTYNRIGVASFRLDRYDEALDYFKAALKAEPDMPEAIFNMKTVQTRLSSLNNARYQERMGNLPEAINYYNEAIASYPDYVAAWYNLGKLYYSQGEYDKAVKHLERAWLLSQTYLGGNEIPYRLAMSYEARNAEGDDGRALSLYEGLDGYRDSTIRAGVLLAHLGMTNVAVASLKAMTAENHERPDRAEAYYQLGVVYEKAGHTDEAAACFAKALGLAPEVEKYKTPPVGGE